MPCARPRPGASGRGSRHDARLEHGRDPQVERRAQPFEVLRGSHDCSPEALRGPGSIRGKSSDTCSYGTFGINRRPLPGSISTRPYSSIFFIVRVRFDLLRPVSCASSLSEAGALGGCAQKFTVTCREDLSERLRRGKPDFRIIRPRLLFAAGDPQGSSLHRLIIGDPHFQHCHGNTPRSFSTASTIFRKSANSVTASLYS